MEARQAANLVHAGGGAHASAIARGALVDVITVGRRANIPARQAYITRAGVPGCSAGGQVYAIPMHAHLNNVFVAYPALHAHV